MLMLTDSASLASVDAISAHNVDALSNGNVHNLASDMNPGGHTKVIRLDRNQKRENRFWRKQRVREKKQRKWEEQVRKQKEEENQDVEEADFENNEAFSDNDPADEHEDDDTADEVDNEDVPERTSSLAPNDENIADINGDVLQDSGFKAEDDEQQELIRPSDEGPTPISEDDHQDPDRGVGLDNENHSLDGEAIYSAEERTGEAESFRESSGHSPEREQRTESAIDPGGNNDELGEVKGEEVDRQYDTSVQQGYIAVGNESDEYNDLTYASENDHKFGENATTANDDAEARPISRHSGDNEESNHEANPNDQTSEQPFRDGYETDDERERTRDYRDDEEQDSAVGGSSEDQAGPSEDQPADSVSDRPTSDWVGPRSVSPYIEQQLASDGSSAADTQQQQQREEEEEAADSAVERDSVFSADEEVAAEPAGSRPDSEAQKRPPSRVSLVYTYASGPKVLSHVELAPETEAERRPASEKPHETAEATEGVDEKNGKHVTFEEDVMAASNVRIRRRRSETVEHDQAEAKQWKEIRKKNKERRKNRTSNTFRSSSTTGSLMNDKRLIKTGNIGTLVLHGQPQPRWNAYFANARALSNSGGPSLTDIIRYQEARRRDAGLQNGPTARRGLANGRRRDERIRTPPAVAGRKHYRVQTEPHLEEIRGRRVEKDRAVQTDPMLDRPSTPLFMPSKTGADVGTQIYEGDLFDFELESAPILEVLVGKTVEQSLLEVMEEEELETLKEHQRRFEERRQAELAEQQRLAERERRHVEEKERRMSQRRAALDQEQETEAKVAASALAQSYLADMVPAVFSNLRQKGFFFNGIERDIEMTFMPWLRDAVEQELDKVLTGREVLDELILDAVRKRREELEQRPRLSSRLPAPPLADPASVGSEPADAPAADEAEDESEEEGDADDEDEEDAAGDEASDEDDAAGGKAGEEAAPVPDDDEP